MKLIDLNYHANNEYTDPCKVISDHWPSLGYLDVLKKNIPVEVVKHTGYTGKMVRDNIGYSFFKSSNRFWHIPFRTHRYILSQKPSIIIVQGFVFPLQVIFLRYQVGKGCAICLQHHGEQPFTGLKGIVQRFTGRFVNAYSFASVEMANDWINAGVISSVNKCFTITGVSSNFKKQDKQRAKANTGMTGKPVFLWVGRLNNNKDPLTVLKAFGKYLQANQQAKLYMIYQEGSLEKEVMECIHTNKLLVNGVKLVGKIPHADLSTWFSAADFYLSGSHREGSGYALIEAMACGCIPIVTAIPSFKKISGSCGLSYDAGDADSLFGALLLAQQLDFPKEINKVLGHFQSHLSFEAYARQVQWMMDTLPEKR